jgi:hypothetical protein
MGLAVQHLPVRNMNLTSEEFREKPDCEDARASFPCGYVNARDCLVNGLAPLPDEPPLLLDSFPSDERPTYRGDQGATCSQPTGQANTASNGVAMHASTSTTGQLLGLALPGTHRDRAECLATGAGSRAALGNSQANGKVSCHRS